MPSAPETLPPALHDALAALDARRRRIALARGLCEALTLGGCGLLAIAGIDSWLHPSPTACATLSIACEVAAAAVLIVRGVIPACAPRRPVELAREAETSAGGLDEVVSAAVQLTARPPPGVSPWMIARTAAIAAQSLARLESSILIPSLPARRALAVTAAVALVVGVSCLAPHGRILIARAALPGARIARPAATTLLVHPGDATVAAGESLPISATCRPASANAEVRLRWADGLVQRLAMTGDGDRYRAVIPGATRDFTYQVLAGDAESPAYRIRVAQPPRIAAVRLRIVPPAYTGLPASEQAGGDASVIAASTIDIDADIIGDDLVAASLEGDGASQAMSIAPAAAGAPRRVSASLVARADRTWWLRLSAAGGIPGTTPQRWLITVRPDAPPSVSLSAPAQAPLLVPLGGSAPLTVVAGDDLGLRSVTATVNATAGPSRRVLALPPMARSAQLPLVVQADPAEEAVGDVLTVDAEAVDCGGQSAHAAPIALTVVAPAAAEAAGQARALAALAQQLDGIAPSLAIEARAWEALEREAAGDDPARRRAELVLIADRARASTHAASAVATALTAMGGDGFAPRAHRLGLALAAWSGGEAEQQARAAEAATRERDRLSDGSAEALAAVTDADRMRHALALLAGAAEARADAAELDAQLLALTRGVEALRSARWRAPPWQTGLRGRYHAGTDCTGAVQSEEVGLPRIDDRQVGGAVATNFSAEWEGEIDIPSAGAWTLGAVCDDGARIAIDGVEMLDAGAWSMHAAQSFTGSRHLAGGWHAIRVQYMQGLGGSVLHLSWGPTGGAQGDLPISALRCRPVGIDAAALAAADPGAGARAAVRLGAIVTRLESLAARLGELDLQGAAGSQDELAQAGSALASALSAALADGQDASGRLCTGATALIAPAQAVETALTQAADKALPTRCPSEIAALEQALARMRDRLDEVRELPAGLPQADRRLATARAFAALQGWRAQFARELPRGRGGLLAEARASADPLAEREGAAASRACARAAHALAELAGIRGTDAEAVAPADEALHALGRQLVQARDHLGHELAIDIVLAADAALARLSSAAAAEAGGRPLAAASEIASMRDVLARVLPALPADDERVAILRAWATATRVDIAVAIDAIRAICPEMGAENSYALDILAELEAAVTRFTVDGARADASADDATDAAHLAAAEAAVGIIGEALGAHPAALHRPGACLEIASDLDAFARGGRSADDFRELSTRARAALLGGPDTDPAQDPSLPPDLAQLRAVAAALDAAAAHPARREQARDALAAIPQPAAAPAAPAAPAAAAPAARALDDEAVDARMRFARAERAFAQGVPAAVGQLPGGVASEAAARALQAAAAVAQDLAAAAADGQLEELSMRARLQSACLRADGSAPLAHAMAEADTPAAAEAFAAAGRQVATLAQQVSDAAVMLEAVTRRLGEMRGQIAGASAAPVAAAPPASVEAAIAGADAASAAALAAMALARQRWAELAQARAQGQDATGALAAAQAAGQAARDAQGKAIASARAAIAAGAGEFLPLVQARLLGAALARQRAAAAADAEQAAAQVAPGGELAAVAQGEEALAAGLSAALAGWAPAGRASAEARAADPSAASRLTAAALATVASAPLDAQAYHVAAQLMHGAVGKAAAAPGLASGTGAGAASPPGGQADAMRGGGGGGGGGGHVDLAQVDPGTAAFITSQPPAPGSADASWARPDADPAAGIRTGSIGCFDADEQAAIKAYVRRLREER